MPQHFRQQRRGADSVHIVITKDDHRFLPLAGKEKTVHRRRHVRQQERVAKLLQ